MTVGTTSFDSLITAVDDPHFVAAARAKGYTSLVIQAREPCAVWRELCLLVALPEV